MWFLYGNDSANFKTLFPQADPQPRYAALAGWIAPTYMPSKDTPFYHAPPLPSLATHTHYFGLVNIIKFSRGLALILFKIWFIKKWIGVGVWVSPVIVTKAKSIPSLYLIYKRDTIFQKER